MSITLMNRPKPYSSISNLSHFFFFFYKARQFLSLPWLGGWLVSQVEQCTLTHSDGSGTTGKAQHTPLSVQTVLSGDPENTISFSSLFIYLNYVVF